MRFFIGLHKPWHAAHFDSAFVNVNVLVTRRSDFPCKDWILDSGAYSEVSEHGGFRASVEDYAARIRRWSQCGNMLAAVAQDFMCEQHVLARTGLTIPDHQRMTIERYDALLACDTAGAYIMPVLQGYAPSEYVAHVGQYGDRLELGAWVGVGSVCKRNGDRRAIEEVLFSIRRARPDLRLHGFGLKKTALSSRLVWDLLHTADSMAWSKHARHNGRNANDWREARRWLDGLDAQEVHPAQLPLLLARAA